MCMQQRAALPKSSELFIPHTNRTEDMELQLQNKTLGQWLEHWAEVTPDKEYIVYSDRDLRFTWKEFNERVDRMAKGMLSMKWAFRSK